MSDWPINDTKFLFSFFILKLSFEITSLLSITYHWMPPRKFSTYLYPGLTVIVRLWIIPVRFPRKIIPLAISVPMKVLSNGIISTGLGDKLYFSYSEVLLNPRRSLIQSSGINDIADSSLWISMIDPNVEIFGLNKNG